MRAPGPFSYSQVRHNSLVLLVLVFMFSLLVLVPVVLIGALVLGYQLRKIKGLHKQSPDGQVIEGEVIYEAIEVEQLKSVRILNAD